VKQKAPLFDLFRWHRIVLDEGHEVVMNELQGGIATISFGRCLMRSIDFLFLYSKHLGN
jgi:hypothetical protein